MLFFLTACGTERVIEKPVIHEVVRTEWRNVPADLLERCEKQAITEGMTYGEAIEAWAKDRSAIDVCNGRLTAIGTLNEQGTD